LFVIALEIVIQILLQGVQLQVVTEERDLGVILQSTLKCDKQCAKAVKAAKRVQLGDK